MVIFLVSHSDDACPEEVKKRLDCKSLREFVEDIAVAEGFDGKFFYVRRDYTRLSDETYEEADNFWKGFAPVKKDGKCYHIRKPDGAPAYDQRFQWVLDFKSHPGLEKAGLLAQVKELDNGRNKGETFKIGTNGKRFYPLASKTQ
ncbi:MAG: hypothetical protein NTZ84_03735 [Candidatus Nealsonbacteria bacterium]|nr:hypothetical protein [Candidatus Nealsonbacteria bacterium]